MEGPTPRLLQTWRPRFRCTDSLTSSYSWGRRNGATLVPAYLADRWCWHDSHAASDGRLRAGNTSSTRKRVNACQAIRNANAFPLQPDHNDHQWVRPIINGSRPNLLIAVMGRGRRNGATLVPAYLADRWCWHDSHAASDGPLMASNTSSTRKRVNAYQSVRNADSFR